MTIAKEMAAGQVLVRQIARQLEVEESTFRYRLRRPGTVFGRRICPTTGTTVAAAWAAEQPLLRPLPTVLEPFDCVVSGR